MTASPFRIIPALTLAFLSACSESPSTRAPSTSAAKGASDTTEEGPPALPDTQTPEIRAGGQTGSGGIPMGFSCDQIAGGSCEASLRRGFGVAQTPLILTASECIPASEVDPNLPDSAVCRCQFSSHNYFSDTGGTSEVSHTIGLARSRATPSEPGDGCELWFQDRPTTGRCLFESSAFSGCSLDDVATSCQSSCQTLAANRAQAVATQNSTVEVAASACVQCNSGNCVGVLRAGNECFFGMQTSLSDGYIPTVIPCDGSADEQLRSQVQQSRYLRRCSLETDAGPQPIASPVDGGPGDAGLLLDAATVPVPADGG